MIPDIIKVEKSEDLTDFTDIIKKSFQTVALQYGLTSQNSPTNPAFTDIDNLYKLFLKADCFGVFFNTRPCGFFALEFNEQNNTFYLQRVCILPEFRHNGFGKMILNFAENHCKNQKAEKISIGIMNINSILKKWYQCNGYIEISTRQFSHLKFEVCFLENRLK